MAKKMSDGGVVNRNMVDGMDVEEGGSAEGKHGVFGGVFMRTD